jgi:hypothetical protein
LDSSSRSLPTVPLVPEEPEHFIRETSGRIVCSHFDKDCFHFDKDKDQIAGRFRVYYADFELAENHQMSAREVLDAYQHTFEYADVILDRNERPFSPRRSRRILSPSEAVLPNLTKRDEPILTGLAAVKVMLRPVRSHDKLSSS